MEESNIKDIILVIIGLFVILIIIFAQGRISELSQKEQKVQIDRLNSEIASLRDSIRCYTKEIDDLENKREEIKEVIKYIEVEKEKKNIDIINGDIDYNVKLLADYLSKKDSSVGGHVDCNNGDTTEDPK